ncbi:discoidin domain-containing protein [Chloroflexia bacterium SDU3-3]|nr:discoidin domain-containing protein [Chloroflexia bacterium SDU3-3]
MAGQLLALAPSAAAQSTNLALNRPVTVSSSENAGAFPASAAVDGNTGTRWSSAFSDPQWLQIDLGSTQNIGRVVLRWEAAYASAYQVQVSNDAASWSTIASVSGGDGGVDDLAITGIGRYVRVYTTSRATAYGASLWEVEIYGAATPTATPTATPPPTATPAPTCGSANLAQGHAAQASSSEAGTYPASAAFDGSATTRWSSTFSDPQWLQVDLGSAQPICRVRLSWEAAYGKAYQIQTSNDAATWTTIASVSGGDGGVDDLAITGTGRYVRMYGTQRTTIDGAQYGYSLWEFEVYGSSSTNPTPMPTSTVPPTATATPTGVPPTATPAPTTVPGPVDFGPNVTVFDPSMSSADIQAKLNAVFAVQESNQFGSERNALLFKPGSYSVDANIGFNTQIAGLGFSPDDVTINGYVRAEADWFGDNGTQNFWRFAENMAVNPPDGNNRWAVSQAAPFRRMHVRGQLQLDPRNHGWSSGGFIADSKIEGQVFSGSQQQYFTRSSQIGSWSNGVWNMVFVGVSGAPAQSFPEPPYTVIGQVPVIREKPFLYINAAGSYQVFVPALRTNTSGNTWDGKTPAGSSLPISQFYIVKPGATAADINAALAQGKDLLVTPGVYHLNQSINVTRANTVVLGLGLATFIPDGGVVAMRVADVDGVKIAGILFDAGTTNSPILLEVGPSGSTASHAANPTSLHDVFARIGGAVAGKATVSVVVNSSDVIIDHTWLWRGDHGSGIGWNTNTADNGLVVNGSNVTAYGLFVEHYQKYNVVWNGNGGRTYFFQNELPYDPPNQASWMNGSTRGYAAYKVADSVTTHEAWGLGSYCYFNVDPSIVAERGFEVPNTPGVRFHDLLTVSLGGNGTIAHVINSTGDAAQGTATVPVKIVSYP